MKDVVLSRNVEYFSVRKIDISYQNQIGSSNHKIKFSNTLISDSGYIQPNQSFSFYLFIFFWRFEGAYEAKVLYLIGVYGVWTS